MRTIFIHWLCVTVCCMAVAGCVRRAPKAPQQAKGSAKAAPASAKSDTTTWKVQGWGKTVEDAQEHALTKARDNARDTAIAYLHRLDPPVEWKPPLDYIRKNLLSSQPERCPDQDKEIKVDDNVEKVKCWSWSVSIMPAQLASIRKEDASYRVQLAAEERKGIAQERMQELGKLVAWMVLALVGVSLYIRVDRWTEATHRRWLRFGLSSIIIGCGVLWLLS